LALSSSLIIQSPTAFALDDGWYKAKSATGACIEPMMRSTIAVQQGAPISLSFTSESLTFPTPVKPSKTPRKTKIADGSGLFDLTIAEPTKNKLILKFSTGDCPGAEVVYSLAQ
jgi:hypothetical protein